MASYGQIRGKGQLTIPRDVREAARLGDGAMVQFEVTEQGVLLRPKVAVDADDAWFWAREWQEGEREAQAELADGEARKTALSHDEFLRELDERAG